MLGIMASYIVKRNRKRDAYWDDEYLFSDVVRVSNIKSVGFSDNAPIEVVNLLYGVVK